MQQYEYHLYHDLAWIWPIMSPPEEYIDETEWMCQILREHGHTEGSTLLHLGCGGGHNDFTLKKHFEVTGVDLSEPMLELAARLNPEISYLTGDMRHVRLARCFDAVLIADAVNYMLTEEELRAAFYAAFTHLKPGGVFLTFAEMTRERFQQHSLDHATHHQGNLEVTYIEHHYDPDPTDTTYETTLIYLIRRNGQLEIHTDRHINGIFPLATWSRLLSEVGFEVEQMVFQGYDIPTFICLKPS